MLNGTCRADVIDLHEEEKMKEKEKEKEKFQGQRRQG